MYQFVPVGRIVLLLVSVAACLGDRLNAQGQSPGPAVKGSRASAKPSTALAIELNLRDEQGQPKRDLVLEDVFYVTLTSNSKRPLEICGLNSKRGWCQLSFELTDLDSGRKYVVRRTAPDDAKLSAAKESDKSWDQREIVSLDRNQILQYAVLLTDCQVSAQDWSGLPKPASGRFSIVAQFESAAKPSETQFWTGAVRSEGVELRIKRGEPRPPHYYLNRGFAKKALGLLKSEPFWISKRDSQRETPLHLAAASGDREVVKWLLAQGADVNATAYNQFTPLHVTYDPEIIALILEKRPDLTKRSAATGQTVLQMALEHWLRVTSEDERRKWRAIADLYLKAGADYDILSAIRFDDLARVKTLMERSPQSGGEFMYHSPLRLAAFLGRLAICRYLIEEKHADVDDFDGGNGYPIITSGMSHPEIVRLLIAHGADLKTRIGQRSGGRSGVFPVGDDATTLHFAAENGKPETVRLLIDKGVDVFAKAEATLVEKPLTDQTALDVAAFYGRGDNVEALVQHAKFQAADRATRLRLLNRCLLSGAAPNGFDREADRPRVLEALLQAGADPNFAENGATALQIAARHLHWISDAEPESSDDAESAAINAGLLKEIKTLRQHGARVDLFSAAAIGDEVEVARLLKQNRALADAKSFDGFPALLVAVARDHQNVVKQLLDAGGDVNIRNACPDYVDQGDTALLVAAWFGRDAIAKLLIDRGADVNAPTADRKTTPLQMARIYGHAEVEKLLLEKGAKPAP